MKSLNTKKINWQGWTEKKRLIKLVVDKKVLRPLLELLKETEVGGRERARRRELEFKQ